MNYNDQILVNKTYGFIKQFIYNLVLSICIILVGILVVANIQKVALYEVLSDSQYPYFEKGDLVVVKPQSEYKVGDIIEFQQVSDSGSIMHVTHRLIGIVTEGNVTYYICHGDNNQSINTDGPTHIAHWEDEAEYLQSLVDSGMSISEIKQKIDSLAQYPTFSQIGGKVILSVGDIGTYISFIRDHTPLFILMVAGIWVISIVVQNEIEIVKSRRLM